MTTTGWFSGIDITDKEQAATAIQDTGPDSPSDWPTLAIEQGVVDSETAYYESLHEAAVRAARTTARDRELANDRQLVHAIRTYDDLSRVTNELAERLTDWGGPYFDTHETGVSLATELSDKDPTTPNENRLIELATTIVCLADETEALEAFIEQEITEVAPNLTNLAGPLLAGRLISLAGGLKQLARKPSGTLQILGAENALFAHLRGHASSPKHGIIYTHEFVRDTPKPQRGSAARALAGKLSIAARIDYYSGELNPELGTELETRIDRIRARGTD